MAYLPELGGPKGFAWGFLEEQGAGGWGVVVLVRLLAPSPAVLQDQRELLQEQGSGERIKRVEWALPVQVARTTRRQLCRCFRLWYNSQGAGLGYWQTFMAWRSCPPW